MNLKPKAMPMAFALEPLHKGTGTAELGAQQAKLSAPRCVHGQAFGRGIFGQQGGSRYSSLST
jgi:hypothetical protein